MKRFIFLLTILVIAFQASAQLQPLPDFSVVERGNRIIVSWANPYESCNQLNVQRSYDSLKYFKTIFSATAPGLAQNGFSEPKQPGTRIFYRIFYVLEGGTYFFTVAKQAQPDLTARAINLPVNSVSTLKNIAVNNRGKLIANIPGDQFSKFRDSILRQTKDTLFAVNDTLVELRRFVPKEVWRPSEYIFTNKEGYINISLKDAAAKKYHIKFFEDNGTMLFEIKHLKYPVLTLDKANFIHAGWFNFELYENDVLKEKNKFYLPKDF